MPSCGKVASNDRVFRERMVGDPVQLSPWMLHGGLLLDAIPDGAGHPPPGKRQRRSPERGAEPLGAWRALQLLSFSIS